MIITYAKILIYLIEYHFIRLVAIIRVWPIAPLPKFTKKQNSILLSAFRGLLANWKILIKRFPHINHISNPFTHISGIVLVLRDLRVFLQRKDRNDSHDLSNIIFDKNCPDYFKRNYHYQTDGYFSYDSAHRYDHQIELLFFGTAHIMRKVAYSVLADVLKKNGNVLEFGAGTGASGDQFKQLFPLVSLDLLEPGKAYLDFAQRNYPHSFANIIPDFMENFRAQKKYDCIFSCFVMHEIPVAYWDNIVQSIKKSLHSNGYLLIVDSQQNGDKSEHQFALDQFEKDFYEPYFKEYREKSLEEYFINQGFKLVVKNEVLFSKSLLFTMP